MSDFDKFIRTKAIPFFAISFIASVFENTSWVIGRHMNGKDKVIRNPIMIGFPLYGIMALTITKMIKIIETKKQRKMSYFEVFLFGGGISTAVEYIFGRIVGAGKSGTQWWDYSHHKFNIHGIISAKHFLIWGAMSTLLVKQLNPYLKKILGPESL